MAQGADLTIYADAEFTPRDIDPPDDGIADVFVAGQPETYKYLFIKAGTEDRACAEFPMDTIPSCMPAKAELHFFIRTLDDNLYPADPIEVKWYEGNGLPDLADYDPVDGQIATVFDGPVQDLLNTNGCPVAYTEITIDVTNAVYQAMAADLDFMGFVFRDTVAYPSHRFDIYSNTWNCQPPSNCCSESYIKLELTYLTPGDADEDGDLDLFDFARFQECFNGAVISGCEPMDFDCDQDVDLSDYQLLFDVFSG